MNIPLEIPIILVCLLIQAFLAGIEIGIISINRHRLMHLVRTGSARARLIESYLHDTSRLLGTTLVGTCLTLVIISTLAESLAHDKFSETGQTLSAILVSLILLIFGEYLPKIWFNSRPVERCLPFAAVLQTCERILSPLVRLVIFLTRWATPTQIEKSPSLFVTREHIQNLVQDSAAGGQISTFERLMINRVLDLQIQTAADVMTPLARVTRVQTDTPLQECFELAKRSNHTRLPVFDADENCAGILHPLEILVTNPDPATPARDRMTPPSFVLPGVRADDLLPHMRRHHQPIILVRDEAGKILGLVTQENIVAFLMGAIPAAGKS
jgi:CBS domain containing-hemolysin-like protein